MLISCINCRQQTSDILNDCAHCGLDPYQRGKEADPAIDLLEATVSLRFAGPQVLLLLDGKVVDIMTLRTWSNATI